MMINSTEWNHGSPIVSIGVLQHIRLQSRLWLAALTRAYEFTP